MNRRHALILLLFSLSGVSGLVYEIVWIRMLSHLLGGTTFAISTVLAAFMGGLALGSRWFGGRVDGRGGMLKLYARLEFGIAALALAVFVLIQAAPPVYASLAKSAPPAGVGILRVVIAMLLLLPPTFLMGGTLPVLSRWLVRSRERLGRGLGLLYAVNTFGAVLGCFLAGFVLVEKMGVTGSTAFAVVVNVAIGLIVLAMARGEDDAAPTAADDAPDVATSATGVEQVPFALLGTVFALSGFASLGYELYWSRALQHFLGNSTYAFSAMLTTFLLGLSAGGWVGGRLADRVRRPATLLGWIQIAVGASALLTAVAVWTWLPSLHESRFLSGASLGWTTYLTRRFLVAFMIMAVPTILIGTTFPIVSRIGIRDLDRLGAGVGRLYFLNTLGSIAGSLTAGFVILPLLAAKGGLVATAGLNAALGVIVIAAARNAKGAPTSSPWPAAVVALALIAAAPFVHGTGRTLLSDTQDAEDEVLFQREDHAAETRVYRKANGEMHMSVDGHHIGGTRATIIRKEKILAHLPLALVPDARSVLAVGLGSGITLGTFSLYEELERLDCVEIVPGVVDGARHFDLANDRILDDPRAEILVGDGVQHLLTTERRYDVISSDSKLNPEYSGNAPLLSRDYYELCRERLSDRGVMVQWLAAHTPTAELEMITRSFAAAFEHVSLFWYDPSNLVLAGSPSPLTVHLDAVRDHAGRARLGDDLRMLQLEDPYVVAGLWIADRDRLLEVLGEGHVNTWDRPRLEFGIVREFRRKSIDQHIKDFLRLLLRLRGDGGPRLAGERDDDDLARYLTSSRRIVDGFVESGSVDHTAAGLPIWRAALEDNPDDQRLQNVVAVAEHAAVAAEQAVTSGSDDPSALTRLGLVRLEQDRHAEALSLFDRAIALSGGGVDLSYNRLLALQGAGRADVFHSSLRRFRDEHPDDVRGISMAGRQAASAGRFEEALTLFRRAAELDPETPVWWNNLATTLARLERYGEAGDAFARVCELEYTFHEAAFFAAASYAEAGRLEESAHWMRFCLERELAPRSYFEESRFFVGLRESEFWPE